MCTSRYFCVIEGDEVAVFAEDIDHRRHRLALIAYDGPPPRPGTWVVAHSGYALAPVDADEVAIALGELDRTDSRAEPAAPATVGQAKETS